MEKNYYDILGISKNCPQKDLRTAFNSLALLHHPDKGGTEEGFISIKKAYDTLIDPLQRAKYDNASCEANENMGLIKDLFKGFTSERGVCSAKILKQSKKFSYYSTNVSNIFYYDTPTQRIFFNWFM